MKKIRAFALFDVRGNIVSDQNKIICISEDSLYLESYGKRKYIGADDVRKVEIRILKPQTKRGRVGKRGFKNAS